MNDWIAPGEDAWIWILAIVGFAVFVTLWIIVLRWAAGGLAWRTRHPSHRGNGAPTGTLPGVGSHSGASGGGMGGGAGGMGGGAGGMSGGGGGFGGGGASGGF